MPRSPILFAALAAVLVAGVDWGRAQPGNDDRDFLDAVVERNHAGIDMGLWAGGSENPAVRILGEKMAHDLREMNQHLVALAHDRGIEPRTGAGVASRIETAVAGMLPGATFDQAYVSSQLEGRNEVLALLKDEARQRDDTRSRVLATQSMTVVQKQIAAIERLRDDTSER